MNGLSRKSAAEADRRASRELAIPSLVLMENAGAGAARVAMERWNLLGSTTTLLAGPGQNGGDAYVVARHLAVAGANVRILALADARGSLAGGDAGTNLGACRAMGLPLAEIRTEADVGAWAPCLATSEILVDGLFGTGLARPLEGPAGALVDAVNASGRPVLALDVPSGLDCDTGLPLGRCVRAAVTVTFLARKIGFDRPGSEAWTGEVVVCPIGAPVAWPTGRPS